ncbi:MAG: hypothetical protein PHC66_01490 [Candidatus Nanoarchaeia archaeon]|nr:hypothetical protein [Candidatus Nanoarchaeia archaeon]MDD5239168.1 hypothetical protein [Candidatus Nanoarchaeia archaeon]
MKETDEAKAWILGARAVFDSELKNAERFTVVVAMCVHAVIRANDALTTKFLKKKAFRHDEAPELFMELVRKKIISNDDKRLRDEVLGPAVQIKSGVDYRGQKIDDLKATEWITSAENFLKTAEKYLT